MTHQLIDHPSDSPAVRGGLPQVSVRLNRSEFWGILLMAALRILPTLPQGDDQRHNC